MYIKCSTFHVAHGIINDNSVAFYCIYTLYTSYTDEKMWKVKEIFS